jgi:hypothetical protein
MELDELKTSWNALDKRLAETEIVNLRMVKEMIQQKTKSAYNGIVGQNLYSLAVTLLIVVVVFPFIYMNTPIRAISFAIVEAMMILGLIPIIWKLSLLSKFDMGGKSCNELSRLFLRYKQICHQQKYLEIAAVCMAMVAFYIIELGFNPTAGYVFEANRVLIVIGLTLFTFGMAFVLGLWQRRRHAQQMQEIERGLEELREFEN